MPEVFRFPEDFIWGAATSSYQIEGATREDGKGLSVWDKFSHIPGNIKNNDTGDIACDHYHRWREDINLMKELGLQAYRFSIAWPRILPDGSNATVNEKGLDFYDRLVDALLAAGIKPFVTLYHWDLPQALLDAGGWPSRSTVNAFTEYADIVTRRLGDRVKHWITHNEPWVVTTHGYLKGNHPPGHRNWTEALATAHHLLLSHGQAVPVIRANSPDCEVGITLNLCPATPASGSEADLLSTRIFDGEFNRWYLDPLFHKKYPADILENHIALGRITTSDLSFIKEGDFDIIATPTDFLGVNYYTRAIVRSEAIPEEENTPREVRKGSVTENGWEIHPDGLYRLLIRLKNEYGPDAIHITENGASYGTPPDGDGRVRDTRRIQYLREHLIACHRAIADAVPLKGYFVWSLMDNFEWIEGYQQRFGIVWIDYKTLKRIPKDSAFWYRKVIRQNAVTTKSE